MTVLGAAVGIGIYGSALADRGAPAASQGCLPAQTAAAVAPVTTTTEAPPPAETTPPQAPPTTQTPTETAPPASTSQSQSAETTTPPGTVISDTSTSQTQGLAGDDVLSLNGPRGGSQPTTPNDYGGPKPPDQAPAPDAASTERTFGSGQQCQNQFGPFAKDFIRIQNVRPNNLAASPQVRRGGSAGTFNVACGNNENKHFNSANMIAAPGNVNGAQHTHDYVGNLTTDGFSSNESLAAAGTTCRNGDKSAYFWPVIRVRNPGSKAVDPLNAHNVGDIANVRATLQFRGNARSKVVAAPQFLRILTGDAKSSTNGGANANAKWTCTGFENRITTKYPLCPRGSQTVRIADFPGCWDGKNTDSANHRTHLAFADRSGACPSGFVAIPQLRITLKYNLPQGRVFALDAFPDEKHNPITDHNDFVNVMGDKLMNQVVNCINSGRRC
ncbi:DUF1996 domain-containing protein [Actinophytocola sp.]|uniref:DUF1996 domain-containing protein n=1 Tax=Actinophytocola sp. TaxID=1872138 RepID=UPI002ED62D43